MKMKKTLLAFLILNMFLVVAVPSFPSVFYGEIKLNSQDAEAGTIISARINNTEKGTYVVTEAGKIGGAEADKPKLIVNKGDTEEILFYVKPVGASSYVLASPNGTFNSSITQYISLNANVSKCSDGTFYDSCSSSQPYYCSSGNLVQRCGVCGCSSGLSCNADGSCSSAGGGGEGGGGGGAGGGGGGGGAGGVIYIDVCGDNICRGNETEENCPQDCRVEKIIEEEKNESVNLTKAGITGAVIGVGKAEIAVVIVFIVLIAFLVLILILARKKKIKRKIKKT